ncbi:MAG TPA: PQQ-binding-like beta-propeller repeat protein [Ktedonobacteraceae bacterium]|nr:PQQ-binding-like beta-propeller repeat protein [Ktedonobacteraceae bacterium]
MSNSSSQNEPPVLQTDVTRPGLYASVGNAVYKLDQRTYQVIWKHTFASDEADQGDPRASVAPDRVLGAGDILLYVGTGNEQRDASLRVFQTADGSVFWWQLSARARANSTTVYTLVESKTAQSSTLTAYDAFTGKMLWQRQYPIIGSKIDEACHSDGFRLITATDQLLYAVVEYRQNGQGSFARYGLSPADDRFSGNTMKRLQDPYRLLRRT